jgi:hypothetical protein
VREARLRAERAVMTREDVQPFARDAPLLEPIQHRAEGAAGQARALVDDREIGRVVLQEPPGQAGVEGKLAAERVSGRSHRDRQRRADHRGDERRETRADAAQADDARARAEAGPLGSGEIALRIERVERVALRLARADRPLPDAAAQPGGDGRRSRALEREPAAPRAVDVARENHEGLEPGFLRGRDRVAATHRELGVGDALDQLRGADEGRHQGAVPLEARRNHRQPIERVEDAALLFDPVLRPFAIGVVDHGRATARCR